MFYVCENQLVFFPFINAVIYSIHPFSIRPGQGCRAPLRGVPGGGLRFGLCFCGLVFLPKKKKGKSFSHFITRKPPFFLFFWGAQEKAVEIWESNPSFVHPPTWSTTLAPPYFHPLQLGSVSPATLRSCHGGGENRCGSRGCGGCHGEGGPAGSGNYTAETWIDGSFEVDNE